jgi:putative membrane protein
MKPDLWKGLLAGAIAGIAATLAKTLAERLYPPRIHGEPEPPAVLADTLAGHALHGTEQTVAVETLHWGLGITAGAFYGVLAEFYPAATAKEGAGFGLALMALTHDTTLPALGLSADPEDQSEREQTSETATHILYGVVAEKVRSSVRKVL